jgi:hypothetical protein
MALTISNQKVFVVGDRKESHADVTFDSSYPTGGESLTAADLGFDGELNYVSGGVAVKSDGTLAVLVAYDYANSKLQAFKSNTAANPQEVADTASLATYKVRLRCVGKGLVSA